MVSRHNRTVKKHRVAVLGNLARTRSGRVAGNVNYWVPNEGGTTYLYPGRWLRSHHGEGDAFGSEGAVNVIY